MEGAELIERVNSGDTAEKSHYRILSILSGGGFTFETSCLLRRIISDFTFIYLITEFGGTPGAEGIPQGAGYRVCSFASSAHPSRLRDVRATLSTFLQTVLVARREGVDLILAVGCSQALPMLYLRAAFSELRPHTLKALRALKSCLGLEDLWQRVVWPIFSSFSGRISKNVTPPRGWELFCDPRYRRHGDALR